MFSKTSIVLLSCIVAIQGLSFELYASDELPEVKEAQYALSRSNAEALVLKFQCYLLVVEAYHPLPAISLQIHAKMITLGIPTADADLFLSDMAIDEENTRTWALQEMNTSMVMANILGSTNDNIMIAPDQLSADLSTIESQAITINSAHQTLYDFVRLHADLLEIRTEERIGTLEGPEVDAIRQLVTDARTILNSRMNNVTTIKTALDASVPILKSALEVIIANSPS